MRLTDLAGASQGLFTTKVGPCLRERFRRSGSAEGADDVGGFLGFGEAGSGFGIAKAEDEAVQFRHQTTVNISLGREFRD